MMRCGYVDTPGGQLHYREWRAADECERPLLCLHPAPFSGLFFSTAMPELGARRRVIAPDYPGYGNSPARGETPDIAAYAHAMAQLLDALVPGVAVDVMGFHSGALVAAELHHLGLAAATVLVDVPFFNPDEQARMGGSAGAPLELDTSLESLAGLWQSAVVTKAPLMGLERSVELMAEQLRVYPIAHRAFRAAFSYDCAGRLGSLKGAVGIIATQSALLDATRKCAASLPAAPLLEASEITRGVFEEGAPLIAARIDALLATLRGTQGE